MKAALFALFPALFAASALAAPAAPARNILTVAVDGVTAPSSLPGICRIKGEVGSVLEGAAYRPGQAITVSLPCARTVAELRNGYDVDMVRRAKFVAVQVDAQGRVLAPGAMTDYGGFYSRDPFIFIDVQPAA